jgi:hypothetical protein
MTRKRQVKKASLAQILDPRQGDIEDDASSTKRRSMLRGIEIARETYQGLLDHRAPSPRDRISMGRKGAVGAYRHRAYQWQLVYPQPEATIRARDPVHGHRHIDWIGQCAGLPLISAPSPVMEVTDDMPTAFYIHTLAIGAGGQLELLPPERIVVDGERATNA